MGLCQGYQALGLSQEDAQFRNGICREEKSSGQPANPGEPGK